MALQDLRDAYLEYIIGKFTADDLKEYTTVFLDVCNDYGWDISDPWQQARFELSYVMNDIIPYNDNLEYISPLTGLHYKESAAVYPDIPRHGDFVLINNDWIIL